jgi:hypothetical protein
VGKGTVVQVSEKREKRERIGETNVYIHAYSAERQGRQIKTATRPANLDLIRQLYSRYRRINQQYVLRTCCLR